MRITVERRPTDSRSAEMLIARARSSSTRSVRSHSHSTIPGETRFLQAGTLPLRK